MKIPANNKPTELSYIDLISGLLTDVKSDTGIPDGKANTIIDKLTEIAQILEPYSA